MRNRVSHKADPITRKWGKALTMPPQARANAIVCNSRMSERQEVWGFDRIVSINIPWQGWWSCSPWSTCHRQRRMSTAWGRKSHRRPFCNNSAQLNYEPTASTHSSCHANWNCLQSSVKNSVLVSINFPHGGTPTNIIIWPMSSSNYSYSHYFRTLKREPSTSCTWDTAAEGLWKLSWQSPP